MTIQTLREVENKSRSCPPRRDPQSISSKVSTVSNLSWALPGKVEHKHTGVCAAMPVSTTIPFLIGCYCIVRTALHFGTLFFLLMIYPK